MQLLKINILWFLLIGVTIPGIAQDVKTNDLLPGIVEILGKNRIGSGLIVKIDSNDIFILTAAHVVLAEPNPKVVFYSQSTPSEAHVESGSELNDEDRGIALLKVESRLSITSQVRVLPLAIEDPEIIGGEAIEVLGLPLEVGDWAILHGYMVARRGRDLVFDVGIDEGASGGAIVYEGKVVGLVQRRGPRYGIGNPVESLWGFIRGMRSLSKLVSEKIPSIDGEGISKLPIVGEKQIDEANDDMEIFDALVATLENISDDYYSLITFKHGITRLKNGVNSSQLSRLISTASIGDDYYCSQAIISGARYLKTPIKSEDIKAMLSTINSSYYRSKAAMALNESLLKGK
ncbi:S1 family peptidase [Nitrospira sp. T9]